MKKLFSILLVAMTLTACGKGEQGTQGPQGIAAPAPASADVLDIVNLENSYRSSVGQAPLTSGMVCTLYTVPNTTTLIIGAVLTNIGSWNYLGTINQPNTPVTNGLNILPTALATVYQSWYIVKCTATLIIADDNYHLFVLTSDDGSNLYVDGGAALINNDGLHGSQSKSAAKLLKYGLHTIEVDYLQAGGQQELSLTMDGAYINQALMYH